MEPSVFALMVEAAFSLWRAVFYAEDNWHPPGIIEKTQQFLESANAVGFGEGKMTKAWMFDYFLNNARFRVIAIKANLAQIVEAHALAEVEALRDFPDAITCGVDEPEPTAAWDKNFAALSAAFGLLANAVSRSR
jgi:hypothetical protein